MDSVSLGTIIWAPGVAEACPWLLTARKGERAWSVVINVSHLPFKETAWLKFQGHSIFLPNHHLSVENWRREKQWLG